MNILSKLDYTAHFFYLGTPHKTIILYCKLQYKLGQDLMIRQYKGEKYDVLGINLG